MTFQERMNSVLNDRMVTKIAVAEKLNMPISTFAYKCEDINRWSWVEFKHLIKILRLEPEEVDFLSDEV